MEGGAPAAEPSLDLVQMIERLLAAARREDRRTDELVAEASRLRGEASSVQALIHSLDAEFKAAQAAAAAEVQRRKEEAQAAREARERARKEAEEARLAAAELKAAEKEARREAEREAVRQRVERQMAVTAMARGEKYETSEMRKRRGVRVWKGLAEEKITQMASSIEEVLENDTQLRDVFASIDLDGGGSIDRSEVEVALKAAGKSPTNEQVDRMMDLADKDNDGDVDLEEFAIVLKAVKASNAAAVVQRRLRAGILARAYRPEHAEFGLVDPTSGAQPPRPLGGGAETTLSSAPVANTPAADSADAKAAKKKAKAAIKIQAVARGRKARKKPKGGKSGKKTKGSELASCEIAGMHCLRRTRRLPIIPSLKKLILWFVYM